MSTKLHIATIQETEIYLNTHDIFKYGGDRRQKDLIEYRVGMFIRTLSIVMIVMPLVWLIYNGSFAFNEFITPTHGSLGISFVSMWTFLYGSYLVRNKNRFDAKPEQKDLQELLAAIQHKHIKRFELENVFTVEVVQMLDEIYAKYKSYFLAAISDYMITVSPARVVMQQRLGVDIWAFKHKAIDYFQHVSTNFDAIAQDFFRDLLEKALAIEAKKIDEEIIFISLVSTYWKDLLRSFSVTQVEVEGVLLWLKNKQKKAKYLTKWERLSKLKPRGAINRAYTSRATPTLDTFARDFTSESVQKSFTVSIGRESEMKSILSILERNTNAAGLLIGEPGVGKTHFLKYLATRMVVEDVPKVIQDSRLVVIDLNVIFTKTGSLEEFKQTLQKMLEEVVMSGNLIIVLEDFSQILSIRTEGKLEVVNTIINMITQYNIKVIATTTQESFAQYIKPIKSLAALFTVVELKEPSQTISLQLLIDKSAELEKNQGVSIQLSALKRIVEYSHRFDYERVMPDKGFALLEDAVVEAGKRDLTIVDSAIIDELLSQKVGVKVGDISADESQLLANLEAQMHKRVIGQEEAIKAVSAALRRARSGLHSGTKPLASFLFFGPTGVGKTEVAKTLTSTYYGDENLMIRLDMSEYQEALNLDRLIGYSDATGRFQGGFLTEAIRQRPFSLVLLDELEKANPKVLDLFLQVLDEGHITDGMGRDIDFTNSIIIATSNAGSKQIADLFDQGLDYQGVLSNVTTELRNNFRVEFLNRFDRVIMFKPLNKFNEVEQIVEIMLNKVKQRLVNQGMDMSWNDFTITQLAEKGISKIYGARELKRVIQEEIEDELANYIVSKQLVPGTVAYFDGLDIIKVA